MLLSMRRTAHPKADAFKVALATIRESNYDGEVVICCFCEADAAYYR